MCAGEIGLQANGLPQGCGGFRQFALLLQYRAEGVVRLGVVRFGLDGGAQLVGGLVELALLPESYAQRVVNVGLAGIEFRGLLAVRRSPRAIGLSTSGPGRDRSAKSHPAAWPSERFEIVRWRHRNRSSANMLSPGWCGSRCRRGEAEAPPRTQEWSRSRHPPGSAPGPDCCAHRDRWDAVAQRCRNAATAPWASPTRCSIFPSWVWASTKSG